MSQPYLGEIRLFAGNFAPQGYAFCNGQLLPIDQNTALFNLIGTTYGGDGQQLFALPDLRSRAPIHQGQGPGLSGFAIGATGGAESVSLSASQMPAHQHALLASASAAGSRQPADSAPAHAAHPVYGRESDPHAAGPTPMNANALGVVGGSQAHENRQPTLALSFIIALQGIYPPQG